LAKLWLECDSTTTQQARNKANGGIKDVKTCRIFAKNYENDELFAVKWRKLWLEWNSTTTQIARIRNAINNNRDEKYEDRLEMSVHNGHDTGVMNWYNAGLRVISKTSGSPIVGDSKTIHISKSRPFWNKCFIQSTV
jgi:hypothetical protein